MRNRVCVFCGGRPLTKEHVIPQWLYRWLVPPELRSRPVTEAWHGEPIREMHGFDVKVRRVCKACNEGWMHDLETAFRSVMAVTITGKAPGVTLPLAMDRGVQQVAATWAMKTWLLLDMATNNLLPAIDSNGCAHLYRHREPPTNVQIFVARHGFEKSAVRFLSTRFVLRSGRYTHLAVLIAFGFLAFYIVVPTDPPEGLEVVVSTGSFDRALTQIWPYQVSEVRWPPSVVLTNRALDALFPKTGRLVLEQDAEP
jgi:hypothetical protein